MHKYAHNYGGFRHKYAQIWTQNGGKFTNMGGNNAQNGVFLAKYGG